MRVNQLKPIRVLNYYGKPIPQRIVKVVIQRMEEEILRINNAHDEYAEENKHILEDLYKGTPYSLKSLIYFEGTPEKYDIWINVWHGEYESFYDFHNIRESK